MTMDLRDIEYFAMVAQHGHLGRAAEALGLGQPALSMSLRRLEEFAQVKLVKRTPKGVELTPVGAALLSHVSKLRIAREDLAREVADLAHGRAGHVRIAVSPSNVDVDLAEACSCLLMQAPKITVDVAVLENDALLPALHKGAVDVVVTHTRQVSHADLAIESVRQDEFVVYCASRHRLAKRKSITLHDLANERWSAATSASGAFGPLAVLREALERRGLPPPNVVLVSDLVTFRLGAVARSDLLGMAIKPIIEEAATRLRLKILPIGLSDWVRPVAVAYRRHGYLSPAARSFIDMLKSAAAERAE